MLRFLLGGLATVTGLVLLFVASFGDPDLVLRQFSAAFSTVAPSHAPAVATDNPPARNPAEHELAVVPSGQPQSSPPPPANQTPSAQSSPPASPPAASPPAASPPAASPPADQTAAISAQREALQQQLQHLQAEMAQASQNVSSLHSQADAERHDLDALQQQRAAEAAQATQQRAAEAAQASQRDTDRDREAAEAAQPPKSPAPDAQSAPQQAAPASAPAPIAQFVEPPSTLPLPPPLPPNPPQQSPPSAAAPTPPPPQVAARADALNAGRLAAASPEGERSRRAAQSGSGAMEAALDRLRQAPPDAAPPPAPPVATPMAPPGPDIASRGQDSPATRGAVVAYGQPRQIGPDARLGMARAALQAGRIPEAQQYLEEAQLQLVFRPVTPDDGDAPGASPVAGDVAAALSMLGAGNTTAALQYVDRAMQQTRPSSYPPPGGYGYGGPYGGAPVAEAGH